jgi:uracil phosphoribosyltransferase
VTGPSDRFPGLRVVDHPLVRDKLARLRDRRTPMPEFRRALREATLLMGYEVTAALPLRPEAIETPVGTAEAQVLPEGAVAIVAILRAGLGMAEALAELLPGAPIGHFGVYRDPGTKQPVEYYANLPAPSPGRLLILADPMLATGGSALAAVDALNRHGVPDASIRLLCLLAAPEGMAAFAAAHPAVPVFTAALDERLDGHAYIVPGLGDAGDRLFGTEQA